MTEQKTPAPPPDRPDAMTWLDEPPRWDGAIDLDRLIRAGPSGIAAAVVDLKSGATLGGAPSSALSSATSTCSPRAPSSTFTAPR